MLKRRTVLIILLAACVAVFAGQRFAEAKKRSLRYLPQDYSMDTASVSLNGLELPATSSCYPDLENDKGICDVLTDSRNKCPDCCYALINKWNNPVLHCDAGDPDPTYACDAGTPAESPFTVVPSRDSCGKDASAPSQCLTGTKWEDALKSYTGACPENINPAGKDADSCKWVEEKQVWSCNQKITKFPDPCSWKENGKACESGFVELKSADETDDFSGTTEYLYRLVPDSTCKEKASQWLDCSNKNLCCRQAVCNNKGMSTACNQCDERVSLEKKYQSSGKYTPEACALIKSNFDEQLLGGKLKACFAPVAPNNPKARYAFIGKSSEVIAFTWILSLDEDEKDKELFDKSTNNFYSMLKIYEVPEGQDPGTFALTEGAVVHYSMVHVKAFSSSFSVYAATAFDKAGPGRVYVAAVCYYIPKTAENLYVKVDDQRFIVHRSRQ